MTSAAQKPVSPPANTTDWMDICALDDLPYEAGIGAILPIGDREEQIALFRLENSEQVFATGNFDPFSKANVLARGIIGSIGDEIVVASPILKQHFSLTSGRCLEDDAVHIPVFPVKVVNGRILVCTAPVREAP